MNWRIIGSQIYGWKQYDQSQTVIFAVIFGIVGLIIIVSLIRRFLSGPEKKGSGTSTGSKSEKSPSYSHASFRRQAINAGFSDSEADFLEIWARRLRILDIQSIFGSTGKLDAFMQNALGYIERNAGSDEEAQKQKSMLFSIREAHALRRKGGSVIRSSRQIPLRTPISLVSSKDAHYSSILRDSDNKFLYLEPPVDAFGEIIRFSQGTKLNVFFYTGNHNGYSFTSKSGGMVKNVSRRLLTIRHSNSVKNLPSRKNQRADTRIPCRFYHMHVKTLEKGKRSVNIDKNPVPGIISNISAGGMSIQTISPLSPGEYLKVDFFLGSSSNSVYASCIRLGRTKHGSQMHCRFVKISRKTANEIQAHVYGYD